MSVQVTDVAGAIDYQTFKIAVANTNDAPVLDDINDQNAYEDTEFVFQLTATDEDQGLNWENVIVNPDETLSFQALDLPAWLSLDASGFLVGTPSDADIGQHEVSVQVTDVAGSTDQQTFNITVNNTNDPPLFEASAQSSLFWDPIFEGVSYELQLVANDPDTYYGDNLVYSMDQSLEWLSVGSDGKVVITADDSNIGSHYLEVYRYRQ